MPIANLFSTPLWVNQIDPAQAQPLNRDLLTFIDRLRADAGVEPGTRWQTPNDLQDRVEMTAFVDFARRFCMEAIDDLKIINKSFLFTGCWANIKPPGAGHPGHTHPNNFLSGVYYVTATERGGRIVFHDPRHEPYIIAPQTSQANAYNSGTVHLDVQPGTLILFPSWLMHSVESNEGQAERISISFNIMFSQFAEQIAMPKW